MYIELYSTSTGKAARLSLYFDLNGKDLKDVDVVGSGTFLGGEKLRPFKALRLTPEDFAKEIEVRLGNVDHLSHLYVFVGGVG